MEEQRTWNLWGIELELNIGWTVTGWASADRIPDGCTPRGWHRYSVRWTDELDEWESPFADIAKIV